MIRDLILSAKDIQPVEIETGWGKLFVRAWSGIERERFHACIKQAEGNLEGRVLAMSVCDSEGVLQFGEQDIPALQGKNGAILDETVKQIFAINGLGEKKV